MTALIGKQIGQSRTRYRVGDLVKYGGQVYSCNTGHTIAATALLGLEAEPLAKWDYPKGIEYLGEWASGYRYKINDVVKDPMDYGFVQHTHRLLQLI